MAGLTALDAAHPLFSAFVFVLGACLGSFLNVCIYRIPLGRSVIFPSSACAACGIGLSARRNLPIFGWFLSRGQCACGLTRVDARYWMVELLSGLILWGLWLKFSWPLFLIYGVFLCALIVTSAIDLDHFYIPDRFTLGGCLVGLLASGIFPALHRQTTFWTGLGASLTGGLLGGGFLWGVAKLGSLAFKKEAMGFGDVKLLTAMGTFLGWPAVFFIIGVSSLLGSVFGGALLWSGRPSWGTRIPYGPYLAAAAALWIFGGADWSRVFWESWATLLTHR